MPLEEVYAIVYLDAIHFHERMRKGECTKKQSQDDYTKKYNSLVLRYKRAEKRLNKATAEREDKVNEERELRLFFETLENKPQLIDTWDENLRITLFEKMEVSQDKTCAVFFKSGISVKVDIYTVHKVHIQYL